LQQGLSRSFYRIHRPDCSGDIDCCASALAFWEEWLNLIVGLWILVSSWVLGFAQGTAMHVHIVIGVLVAVLAAIELWILYQAPPSEMVRH